MAGTYNSTTNLSLGQVPQVEDTQLYIELLNIHDALEIALVSNDDALDEIKAFIAKQKNLTDIVTDYTVLETDGTIRVDASAGNITVTMHPVADGIGLRYNIKRIDTVTTNKVTIVGDGVELIDTRANGINLSTFSSYTVKNNSISWDII